MGQKYLIDSNIIIYFVNNELPQKSLSKISMILKESFIVSTISNIETLGWYNISEKDQANLDDFLSNSTVIYIDKLIEYKAIEIRQQKKMKLGDSIIAATALVNDLTIVTRNETDFYGLGLTIYNPFDQK
jgi:predicted nucleic acid-binding protein